MLYSIVAEDQANSLAARTAARPEHLKRLAVLQSQGRLVLAGPNPSIDCNTPGEAGFSGSIIVAEFSTLAAAEDWANTDPYVVSGVYKSVSVKPFKQVFPS